MKKKWHDTRTVYYNENPILVVNKDMLDKQNAWAYLVDIKEAHWLKLVIYDLIRHETGPAMLKSLAKDLTEIEFRLQELWGFEKNENWHRFWLAPQCSCPRMDNEDGYPYRSVINSTCVLHGGI